MSLKASIPLKKVEIYDTTLRDGAQLEGISLTVDDKLRIATQLDRLGVHYIEGGWPGANPKDEEFFARASTELNLKNSQLVAFGSTRRVSGEVEDDVTLRNLIDANTEVVCIVGKASAYHVTEALRTSLEEGIAMVEESIRFLKSKKSKVFFDAEHFFDGYKDNPDFSLEVLEGASRGGADCVVLCDTNGGSLPHEVEKILSNAGILKNNNFYDPDNLHLVHHVNQALRANHLYENGRDYIVKDGQVVIIDEQTGRQLPGRRFGDGLHQSIEAKERVEIQNENQTLASITYQNYFKLYSKLAGCTGTAATESEEFFEIYKLPVIIIPTNKKMIRKDWNDQIFRSSKEKDDAIIKKILECNKTGQPLLVFTANINKSEHYSNLLNKEKINHTVLNAKNHEKEAEIILNAGKKNSIIITTSISGRGVDIKLGGKSSKNNNEKEEIKSLGGLYVIGTERMESRRVDNQARGRSGRQGDEGNSIFYVSLQDDLMRIFGSESMNSILEKLGLKDGESIDHPWINKALERAQQKVEARNFDIRKTLLKFDNVLNDQRKVIFSQRNNIIVSKNSFDYSDEFLNEIIIKLKELKKLNLTKDKNNESSIQINFQIKIKKIGKNLLKAMKK